MKVKAWRQKKKEKLWMASTCRLIFDVLSDSERLQGQLTALSNKHRLFMAAAVEAVQVTTHSSSRQTGFVGRQLSAQIFTFTAQLKLS